MSPSPGEMVTSTATCSGVLMGGGFMVITDNPADAYHLVVTESRAISSTTWAATGVIGQSGLSGAASIQAFAICAPAP